MLWRLIGGSGGLVAVAAVAAIGVLVPRRYGNFFLDPVILLLYTAIGVIFASNFVVRGVVGSVDEAEIRRVVKGGAVYGFLCWAVILGAALTALSVSRGRVTLPPALLTVGLVALAGAAAWLGASLAAWIGVTVSSVRTAQGMTRMALFFVLIVLIVGPRLLPAVWQDALAGWLNSGALGGYAMGVSVGLVYVGYRLLVRVRETLAERRTPLRIT